MTSWRTRTPSLLTGIDGSSGSLNGLRSHHVGSSCHPARVKALTLHSILWFYHQRKYWGNHCILWGRQSMDFYLNFAVMEGELQVFPGVGLWYGGYCTKIFYLTWLPFSCPWAKKSRLVFPALLKHAQVHAQSLSHVQLFATPWPAAHQAPLSMEFSRQEYWTGLPFPSLGYLPDPGVEPTSLRSPALTDGFFTTEPTFFCHCCWFFF